MAMATDRLDFLERCGYLKPDSSHRNNMRRATFIMPLRPLGPAAPVFGVRARVIPGRPWVEVVFPLDGRDIGRDGAAHRDRGQAHA